MSFPVPPLRAQVIHVHIDRIVLRGLDAGDRHAFVAGLRHELSRLLAEPQASSGPRSRRTPVLRLGRMAWQPGPSGARHLGAQVAAGISRNVTP